MSSIARRTTPLRRAASAALAAAIVGCSSLGSFTDQPPDGYSLSGTWKLDPALSSDSRKALAQLQGARTRAQRSIENADNRESQPGRGADEGRGGNMTTGAEMRLPAPDITLQSSLLRGGGWLRIEQRPGELRVDNGDTSHSFVAGERSVVSVPSGVADQSAGWKGKEFRIEVHPQVGPRVSEAYRLSDDGKHLIHTIQVASEGRIPAVKVTRVYDPTNELPEALPAGD